MTWPRMRRLLAEISPPLLTRVARGAFDWARWRALLRQPPGERGPAWYDRAFALSDVWRRHYTESHAYPVWAVIADRLLTRGASSVLELGCGSGQLALLLHDKGIASYVGLDFSPARIEHARRSCPDFDFRAEDVLTTGALARGDYDAVVAKAFLEHVEADLAIVERVRAGALLIASVPNFPAASHVRHFGDEDEVAARYGPYLSGFRVDRFPVDRHGSIAFLFQGTRT